MEWLRYSEVEIDMGERKRIKKIIEEWIKKKQYRYC